MTDIINTPIITQSADSLWTDSDGKLNGLEQRQVVVISAFFQNDSPEEVQLKKMLAACKLEDDQFHIILLSEDENLAWHLIRNRLQPKQIILTGVSPEQLGINVLFMPHQVTRFNECSWIVTGSLQQLIQHEDVKKHVWNYGLKPVFIDKIYG